MNGNYDFNEPRHYDFIDEQRRPRRGARKREEARRKTALILGKQEV
jgi:hypothetical protein